MVEPLTAFALATALSTAGNVGGQIFGANRQQAGLESAGRAARREARAARRQAQQMLAFQRQVYEEGAPLRQGLSQAALGALPGLQEFAQSPVGGSIRTQNLLQSGQTQLASGISRFGGSTDSSAFGLGLGRVTSDVLGQAEQQRLQTLQFLASQRPESTLGFASQLGGQAGQQLGIASQFGQQGVGIQQNIGAVGGALGQGIGNALGQAPLNFALLNQLQGAGGGGVGGVRSSGAPTLAGQQLTPQFSMSAPPPIGLPPRRF